MLKSLLDWTNRNFYGYKMTLDDKRMFLCLNNSVLSYIKTCKGGCIEGGPRRNDYCRVTIMAAGAYVETALAGREKRKGRWRGLS